jgi:hypothetical protein
MRLPRLPLFLLLGSVAAACGGKVVLDTTTSSSSSSGTGASGTGGAVTTTTTGIGVTTSTGDTGTSISSSSGGDCTNPETDCSNPGTVCVDVGCSNGVCVFTNSPEGTACVDNGGKICNGAGQCVACVTAMGCPQQGTTCVVPICAMNTCGLQNAPAGTACTDSGGTVCDGNGKCVGCTGSAAACCIQNCENSNVGAYERFVGYELESCGCTVNAPCASVCGTVCAAPSTLMPGTPCAMCLTMQTIESMSSPCTTNAGVKCIGDPQCSAFVQCGLQCP